MTHSTKHSGRAAIAAAVLLTALILAGCSSGHIGESWQCPLAEGGSCDSVAAADPAVPDAHAARTTVLQEPLWRVRGAASPIPAETSCAVECDGGFDPFVWLARLFGEGEGADGDTGPARADTYPSPRPAASCSSTS